MYDNGEATSLSDNKPSYNSIFEEVVEGKTVYEDMVCTLEYNNKFNYKKFKPSYTEYWLKQGCGKTRMNSRMFDPKVTGWRTYFNDNIKCGAFWTNMDNSYFASSTYQWGQNPDDLTNTVSCSAARGFDSAFSYVKLKIDEPIKVKVGYNLFGGSDEKFKTPQVFGWSLPIVILVQATGATALTIATGSAMFGAILF